MHIVHIITGLDDGGAEGVLFRLCAVSPGDHVVVSLTGEGKYGPLLRAKGVAVHTLGMPRGRLRASALRRLYVLLRTIHPEVVQTWMYHADLIGGIVARLAGCRRVFWNVRNSDLKAGSASWSTIATMRLSALLSRWVPERIACCAHAAAELHQALGYARSKFVIIPNGIDGRRFRIEPSLAHAWRARHGIAEDTRLLGMVGRFAPQKDHLNLIEALRLVRSFGHEVSCVLVGNGVDERSSTLVDAIEEAGLAGSVRLLGSTNDVPAVMNAIDVHVLSSRYGEAFPNVVAEAMACGTPCVVTDVGDARLIVRDTGWVVPPGDAQSLAHAIDAALRERERGAAWEDRCRRASESVHAAYAMPTMVRSYERMWRSHA